MNRIVQVMVFIFVVLIFVGSTHYYIWARMVRDTQLPVPWKQIVTGAIIFLGVCMPLAMIMGRVLPFGVSRFLVFVPYFWMGAMLYLLMVLLMGDIAGLAAIGGAKIGIFNPDRRLFVKRLAGGIGAALAMGVGSVAFGSTLRKSTIHKIEVELSKLPASMDGYTIVQLSDLHIGITLGRDWLAAVVAQVKELNPKMIAITGDLVDGFVDRLKDQVTPLADLQADDGVFFVTGNHEYYSDATAWMPVIEKLGVRILRNERVKIAGVDGFDLAGVDDFRAKGMAKGHGADMKKALAGRDENREVVLLAHQPLVIEEAALRDVGLVLAGHTHGGQIWPWNYLVTIQQPYVKGLHKKDNTQIYINQGTGFWGPPMRLGTTGEITLVTLRSAIKNNRAGI